MAEQHRNGGHPKKKYQNGPRKKLDELDLLSSINRVVQKL
jgi:hypothetical protein